MAFTPTTTQSTATLNLIKNDTPYLALYTTTPTVGGGGTEVSGGSYARQAITYGAISSASMSNSAVITFTGMPNATVTHYAVLNAATGGTMKGFGALNSPVTTVTGDQVQFVIGAHSVSVSGS